MTVFGDSSALVKLYADEPGSDTVQAIGAMYVAAIARVEVPAALWRKSRMGQLDEPSCHRLVQRFEHDLFSPEGVLTPTRLADDEFDRAAALTAIHGLRAYDAVQLVSALLVRSTDPACQTLATFDAELAIAAAREGFDLIS